MTKQIDNPLVIIFALSVLCACQFGQTIPADFQISTIAQPTSPLDLSPQNISLFGEVALRALTHQRGNIGLSKVQLWPGKVPTSWSVKLPLLNETVIIGSLSAEQGIDPVIQIS